MLRCIQLVVIILAMATPAFTSGTMECTQDDAYKAETEIDNLKTWDDLYRMFKRYSVCSFDDGAIGEGYSDTVGLLLANDWKNVEKLKKLCDADKTFESFVYKHLDMTIPADTWDIMTNNATKKCPPGSKRICKLILKANADIEQKIKQERLRETDETNKVRREGR